MIIVAIILLLLLTWGQAFSGDHSFQKTTSFLFHKYNITNTKPLKQVQTPSIETEGHSDHTILEEFFKATAEYRIEKAKELLLRLDTNTQSWSGISPLYQSVFYNIFILVQLLLERGADVNLSDHEGLTPLHVAALENLNHMANVLIDSGALLDAKDIFGYTPLHLATDQSSDKVAQMLIEKWADVNTRSHWGNTPLHSSIAKGNMRLANI